jgi:hypothetical protein
MWLGQRSQLHKLHPHAPANNILLHKLSFGRLCPTTTLCEAASQRSPSRPFPGHPSRRRQHEAMAIRHRLPKRSPPTPRKPRPNPTCSKHVLTSKPQEATYENEKIDFDSTTRDLHRMSRHWLTLGQDCRDLQAQLDFMLDSHGKFEQARSSWNVGRSNTVSDTLDVLRSQCDICLRWTQVYRERTDIRINLVRTPSPRHQQKYLTQILALPPREPTRSTNQQANSVIHG